MEGSSVAEEVGVRVMLGELAVAVVRKEVVEAPGRSRVEVVEVAEVESSAPQTPSQPWT